jgi:hypothetical protein
MKKGAFDRGPDPALRIGRSFPPVTQSNAAFTGVFPNFDENLRLAAAALGTSGVSRMIAQNHRPGAFTATPGEREETQCALCW